MTETTLQAGCSSAGRALPLARLSAAIAMGLLLYAPLVAHAGPVSSTPAAQDQGQPAAKAAKKKRAKADAKEVKNLQAVVVTGIRASVEQAQDVKRYADTFVDSVSATDIGALPDRSVTDTLARIPGVTIDHFLSQGDPEHFSAEGNGVQVRGLTQVRSELNGGDSFSANGGRALSFQDVPPELMSGIDVYKNQTADMIEGGLGGTVNLRTFMPFDFQGQKIAASVSENYGNFVKKYKPSGSVLYSNRWHTRLGEMGFLVDVADSQLSTRTDGLFVRPFFKNASGTWVPRGADWRTLLYDRKRDGTYLAFQWRPSDNLDFHATAFQSKYHEVWNEDAIFVSNDPTQVMVDASQPSVVNGGVFQSGRLTQSGGMPMGTDIRASNSHSKTTDFSTGMKWRLGTSTEITSAVQFVKATTNSLDSTVALGTNVPYIDVALNGSSPPHLGVDSDFTGNPANYYWGFTQDHQDQNYARELAWRADIDHTFADGFVQGVRAGVRLTNRYADNIDTGYNWVPVFQTWMQGWALPSGALPGLDLNGTINSSLVHLDTFKNFYKGDAGVPGAFYAPVPSTALGYPGSYADIHNAAIPYYIPGNGYDAPYQPTLLDAAHTNIQHEKTYAVYAMLDFGVDDAHLSGNIGVRAVKTRNAGQGFLVYPNQALAPYLGTGQSTPISARNEYTDVLPSFNVKWEFAPNLLARFAFSKAIARPDFSQMQAYQILNAGVVSGYTPPAGTTVLPIDKLTLTGTSTSNPYLTPMKANQFDLSLEWYFDQDRGGMAWVNLFRKSLSNYFRNESEFVTYPGIDGNNYQYLITRPVNVGKATINGAEIGWNQFFDFLPVKGFGMSANYTYIRSRTHVPNDTTAVPLDTDGSGYGSLPADGLSRDSLNVAGFYEHGPWQIRLAYNWRSQYLLSIGPNGYNGTDNNIPWKLPVFADAYGQLDGSIFYAFNRHLKLGLEMNNINNAEQRTIMYQNGAGKHITSWYVNDTRYALTLRATF
ncbi:MULTISPECIES: TonB-dependent receptor [Rhodanobacter]|uniref:TonB-dependent receptor n=1 Tax=Rhodanobacter glycinis TaxID=582702 RepID=A0A1I3Z5S9_9GAMM|nr:TonB-dependent receptor [Rhodanobacter glycinis]SFK39468.1 TonB-dependent receptor [Rhodanobacter glycinis]